jgi:hypothetical protein
MHVEYGPLTGVSRDFKTLVFSSNIFPKPLIHTQKYFGKQQRIRRDVRQNRCRSYAYAPKSFEIIIEILNTL